MRSLILYSLFVLMLLNISFAAADEAHHHEVTAEQLGSVSFPTSCASTVQKQFERGVAWLYSFEYEQAETDFRQVAEADPECAMAYWGQAMSLFHQLWDRPNKHDIARGAALLDQANKVQPKTQRERGYIQALTLFYSGDDPEEYRKRLEEYSEAMDKLRQDNPKDREASVFYALSLLSLSNGKDPGLVLERKAVVILDEQLPGAPNHPGITHYIIHATDNPQLAPMGLEAAREYARIAPASVHAIHMPSHIFSRLGLWQDSIQSNLAALAVADRMTGLHMGHHQIHSRDFLEYAYLQIGDDRSAKAQITAVMEIPKESISAEYVDALQAAQMNLPATYALERRQWKEANAIAPDPTAPPYVQAIAYWAHAVAAGYSRDAEAARAAMEQLQATIEATKKSNKSYLADEMETSVNEASAWALYAEGKGDEAVALMQKVAEKQDKVGKGETEIPAREMLADMLLDLGRDEDALREYETSLQTDPNRFNGLYGAARAAESAKQPEKANQYYAQLLKNCSTIKSDRPELAAARAVVAGR